MIQPPPTPTLFPYTTLFRSQQREAHRPNPRSRNLQRGNLFPRRALRAPRRTRHPQEGIPAEFFEEREERSEEHTSELQSQSNLVCRLLLEKKKKEIKTGYCT